MKKTTATDGLVDARLRECAQVKAALAAACAAPLKAAIRAVLGALRRGKKVYFFGNGGSAADAQHMAAELQGRFYRNRRPLPVIALTTNTSLITAVANDLGYDEVFVWQVDAQVGRGDVVFALSTSGRSRNVIKAARRARELGATVICMTGRAGGPLKGKCDLVLQAPSDDVARIQECHVALVHILCEAVEHSLFDE